MKLMQGNKTFWRAVGGPWFMLGMGLLTLGGLLLTFAKKRRTQSVYRNVYEGDRSFFLSMLTGKWYELAHVVPHGKEPRVGVSFQFQPVAADEFKILRTSYDGKDFDAPQVTHEAYLIAPDVARPWELIYRLPGQDDEYIRVLHSDVQLGVLILGTDDAKHILFLHSKPEMKPEDYEEVMEFIQTRGVPVQKLKQTPQPA